MKRWADIKAERGMASVCYRCDKYHPEQHAWCAGCREAVSAKHAALDAADEAKRAGKWETCEVVQGRDVDCG